MKGFILKAADKVISGGLNSGITDVLISNKEFYYRLNFGGMDDANVSYTWYSEEVQPGDIFTLRYEEISETSPAIKVRDCCQDYVSTNEDDREALEQYYRLKKELIEEGLINLDQ